MRMRRSDHSDILHYFCQWGTASYPVEHLIKVNMLQNVRACRIQCENCLIKASMKDKACIAFAAMCNSITVHWLPAKWWTNLSWIMFLKTNTECLLQRSPEGISRRWDERICREQLNRQGAGWSQQLHYRRHMREKKAFNAAAQIIH